METGCDQTNSALKRTRDDFRDEQDSTSVHSKSNDDWDYEVAYHEVDFADIRATNKRLGERFEQLLMDVHLLEAKHTRLCQRFEEAPSETTQDELSATQSALQVKRAAMGNLQATVEANCQILHEDLVLYIPYSDDAWT